MNCNSTWAMRGNSVIMSDGVALETPTPGLATTTFRE